MLKRIDVTEQAAILAGLRLLQHFLNGSAPDREGITEIYMDGGTLNPLGEHEIDALCERLNGEHVFELPEEPTNQSRAERAHHTLRYYLELAGGGRELEDTDLSDLTSDLLHLADGLGFDAALVSFTADNNYAGETDPDDDLSPGERLTPDTYVAPPEL